MSYFQVPVKSIYTVLKPDVGQSINIWLDNKIQNSLKENRSKKAKKYSNS